MKTRLIIFGWILSLILIALFSGYAVYNYMDVPIEPEDPIIFQPVVSEPVKRPETISKDEAFGHLQHYDNDPFIITWEKTGETKKSVDVGISGSLYQRNFTQQATIPISEQGNFKLYFGIGLGAVGTVGLIYGGYKLSGKISEILK